MGQKSGLASQRTALAHSPLGTGPLVIDLMAIDENSRCQLYYPHRQCSVPEVSAIRATITVIPLTIEPQPV